MRGPFVLIACAAGALATADPLGTRPSPMGFDAAPVGIGPVVQLLLALALVGAGIKFALPAIVRRFGGRLSTEVGGTLHIEESAAFPGGRLYVVQARGRTLLLGTTTQSVNLLADLTESDFEGTLADAQSIGADPQTTMDRLARLERLGR